ncbi:hypothetical protein [Aureimonas mangrovi]|uniref:hypothetical protein n=1 Tax=Aureimonas mangrovi TaxID=2758041 RepID=UPI00163D584B|nr:hypothetical protein [Aureimonas mangrovi]
MNHFIFGGRHVLWLLTAAFAVAALTLVSSLALGLETTSIEAGPLETSQEALLLATMALYGWAAFDQRAAARMASVGALTMAGIFFFRELEVPPTGALTTYLNSNAFRWHETFVVLGIAIPYIVLRWRLMPTFIAYLRGFHTWPYVLVGLLLLTGDWLDGMEMATPHLATVIEEAAETLAYAVFALTGLHVLMAARAERPVAARFGESGDRHGPASPYA